jgi:hypothetical protein
MNTDILQEGINKNSCYVITTDPHDMYVHWNKILTLIRTTGSTLYINNNTVITTEPHASLISKINKQQWLTHMTLINIH